MRELRFFKREETLLELYDFVRKANERIKIIPEEERERRTKSLVKEIIPGNFPNLGKQREIKVHKTSITPYYLNEKFKRPPRYIETVKSQ